LKSAANTSSAELREGKSMSFTQVYDVGVGLNLSDGEVTDSIPLW